jgi:hypothetical protein
MQSLKRKSTRRSVWYPENDDKEGFMAGRVIRKRNQSLVRDVFIGLIHEELAPHHLHTRLSDDPAHLSVRHH